MKVIVVRDGSAILFSEFGQKPVKIGDVILLGANVLCGSEPEGHITVTTVYLDTDYVLDQVRWQYAGFLEDRLNAQGFADTIYTEPAQILRLGEDRAGMLMPWLDELVSLSIDGNFVRHYYRIHALWFQIMYVVAPFMARIEMLLLEQVPHQVVGADDDLVRLPELLRAFVRWAHSGGGIDPSLTEESLATISQCEPDYLGLIGRHTTGGTDGRYQAWLAEQSRYYRQVLEESVGGAEQLARLDDRPLPDEPFDLDGIPADITAVVEQVREHCDRCADEVFDVEHRTAMRRFLHRAAVGQPAIFRRKASTVRAAAAIAWAIGRANETVGSYRCITAKDLQARFGLSGSAAQRALPMLRAIGASDQTYGFVALRTPDLLVSTRRAQLIRERDDLD